MALFSDSVLFGLLVGLTSGTHRCNLTQATLGEWPRDCGPRGGTERSLDGRVRDVEQSEVVPSRTDPTTWYGERRALLAVRPLGLEHTYCAKDRVVPVDRGAKDRSLSGLLGQTETWRLVTERNNNKAHIWSPVLRQLQRSLYTGHDWLSRYPTRPNHWSPRTAGS